MLKSLLCRGCDKHEGGAACRVWTVSPPCPHLPAGVLACVASWDARRLEPQNLRDTHGKGQCCFWGVGGQAAAEPHRGAGAGRGVTGAFGFAGWRQGARW